MVGLQKGRGGATGEGCARGTLLKGTLAGIGVWLGGKWNLKPTLGPSARPKALPGPCLPSEGSAFQLTQRHDVGRLSAQKGFQTPVPSQGDLHQQRRVTITFWQSGSAAPVAQRRPGNRRVFILQAPWKGRGGRGRVASGGGRRELGEGPGGQVHASRKEGEQGTAPAASPGLPRSPGRLLANHSPSPCLSFPV